MKVVRVFFADGDILASVDAVATRIEIVQERRLTGFRSGSRGGSRAIYEPLDTYSVSLLLREPGKRDQFRTFTNVSRVRTYPFDQGHQ